MLKKSGDLGDDGAPAPRKRAGTGTGTATAPRAKRGAAAGAKEERTSARQFVKEVRGELRKVAWPTRSETINYAIIVFATLVLLTLVIFGLDWVFSEAVLRLFEVK